MRLVRTWLRAVGGEYCGGPCGLQMKAGAPMLRFSIPEISRLIVRCEHCAGEAVPADLPATVESAKPARLEVMARLGLLPLDQAANEATAALRSAKTREREPGEEG